MKPNFSLPILPQTITSFCVKSLVLISLINRIANVQIVTRMATYLTFQDQQDQYLLFTHQTHRYTTLDDTTIDNTRVDNITLDNTALDNTKLNNIVLDKLSWEHHTRRYKLSQIDSSCKMSDSQLNLESKTEMSVAKAQNYICWGGHRTEKM